MNWTSETVTVFAYPKAIMTLEIPSGVSGQQIIDAARAVVEKNQKANPEIKFATADYYRDDDTCFVVGQQSMYPYHDLVLSVEDAPTGNLTHLINPKGGYIFLRVESNRWNGEKYPVGYQDRDHVDSCKYFRDELGKLLNAPTQPGE